MNCTDVVSHFTDYLDGRLSDELSVSVDRHLDGCAACLRYREVLERGAEALRSLPEPELRADFEPRLQHRLFHVDDERTLRANGASGSTAVAVLGIAVLLNVVAWSPLIIASDPVVELAPIVVDRAPERPGDDVIFASPPGTFSSTSVTDLEAGLWANTLLYDYSPLSQRYERRARVRRAGDSDR